MSVIVDWEKGLIDEIRCTGMSDCGADLEYLCKKCHFWRKQIPKVKVTKFFSSTGLYQCGCGQYMARSK